MLANFKNKDIIKDVYPAIMHHLIDENGRASSIQN